MPAIVREWLVDEGSCTTSGVDSAAGSWALPQYHSWALSQNHTFSWHFTKQCCYSSPQIGHFICKGLRVLLAAILTLGVSQYERLCLVECTWHTGGVQSNITGFPPLLRRDQVRLAHGC